MRWLLVPILIPLICLAELAGVVLAFYSWLKDYRRWEGGFRDFYRTLRQDALRE